MGAPLDTHPQGEDCLNLTVTTPTLDDGARPVLVWFHGGGFSSGAGLMDWYDGGALAAQGDVVVASVNYRIGALGYLCLDGISEGNLGLYDQLEALRWVSAHIAAYGGDPGNVTVFGQSAGGLSIRMLMERREARRLLHRAILQRAPLSITARPRTDSEALARIFVGLLAEDPLRSPPGFPRSWRRSGRPRGPTCDAPEAHWNPPSSRSSSLRPSAAAIPPRPYGVWTSCTAGTPTT